jgi:ectoine hydroxylase-related dioxygenase (phytanoyl-CoA dioxygenase family)
MAQHTSRHGRRLARSIAGVSPHGRRWWNVEDRGPTSLELDALQRYTLDVRGYLVFDDVLDARAVAGLRAAIDARRLPRAADTIESQRFGQGGQLFAWDTAFADLVDHPVVVAVLRHLIGPHVRLDHAYGITMRAGTSGLGLHGPGQPFDPSQYYLHRMGATRSGLVTFTWALSDGRPGQGGFGCIPGSHRTEEPLPAGAEALLEEIPQQAGSLLVFTEALMHATLPWNGLDTRWAVLYKYSPGNSAWDPSPAASPEVVAGLPERQRLFFQPPSIGGHRPTIDA